MSNEIQGKIQKITAPLTERQGVTVSQGQILDSNEKTNSCKVKYTKKDGTQEIKYNVQLVLANNGVIDWFPEKGEMVLVQEKDGAIFVIGPAYDDYSSVRESIMPKKDVLADTFGSFFGGQVF